ncbi:hypothetical protein [Halalkalicoccus salilacus]|uniref:hypothetical protein n=1 Tax=Halalkalicoccus salilacus TaxID=3117459 RepID=UPI00300EF58E
MAPSKDDDAETEKYILQDSREALAEESGNRTSDDWSDVGRRPLLKALGAGAALSAVSGVVSASDDGDDDNEGAEVFLEDLTTVLSTTHKYRQIDEAIEDGYEEFGVEPPVGHIYRKSGYFEGAEFTGPTELTEPPALLFYAPIEGEGDCDEFDLVLAGLEYLVSGDQTNDPPTLFTGEDTSYSLTVTEEEGWHRSPVPEVIDATGLHVWLYISNPAGLFHVGHPILEQVVNQ